MLENLKDQAIPRRFVVSSYDPRHAPTGSDHHGAWPELTLASAEVCRSRDLLRPALGLLADDTVAASPLPTEPTSTDRFDEIDNALVLILRKVNLATEEEARFLRSSCESLRHDAEQHAVEVAARADAAAASVLAQAEDTARARIAEVDLARDQARRVLEIAKAEARGAARAHLVALQLLGELNERVEAISGDVDSFLGTDLAEGPGRDGSDDDAMVIDLRDAATRVRSPEVGSRQSI